MQDTSPQRQRLQQRLISYLVLCAVLLPAVLGFLLLAFVADGVARWLSVIAAMLALVVVGWFAVQCWRIWRKLNSKPLNETTHR